MPRVVVMSLAWLIVLTGCTGVAQQEQTSVSLAGLEPEHYRYVEAERCANCHDEGSPMHLRAVGVDVSSETPQATGQGWLASVHARSQSHESRVSTACAWCHAPTTPGATRDSLLARPISRGTWEGVTCGACHPSKVEESLRQSLLVNFIPGTDPTDPASYIFIDKSDPIQMNAQCQYCHHEFHGILVQNMADHLHSGSLRCIDCHMAGYGVAQGQIVERFHNMKVQDNGPLSCSGQYGTDTGCHSDATVDWMQTAIPTIKGPRADW